MAKIINTLMEQGLDEVHESKNFRGLYIIRHGAGELSVRWLSGTACRVKAYGVEFQWKPAAARTAAGAAAWAQEVKRFLENEDGRLVSAARQSLEMQTTRLVNEIASRQRMLKEASLAMAVLRAEMV